MYGPDAQNTKPIDTPLLLSDDWVKQIDQIVGKFLYYSFGVDNMCLVPLSSMESRIDPTEKDYNNIDKVLD